MSNLQKKDYYFLGGIILLGILLRGIHLYFFSKTVFFSTPIVDALYHHLWAQKIAAGNILPGGPFFRAPFYVYFISLFYFLFGVKLIIPILLNFFFGLLTCFLVYKIAWEMFQKRIVSVTAGLIAAIYPMFIFFESFMLLDIMASSLNLIALLFIYLGLSGEKKRYLLLGGFFLGISAITRPTVLICIPFLALWLLFFSKRQRLKYLVSFIAPILLVILPITLNNYITEGDFILISSQGGVNFYIGNNENADGVTAVVPEFGGKWKYKDCIWEAKKNLKGEVTAADVSGYYYKKGMRFILEHPVEAGKLFIKKFYLALNNFEVSNNVNINFIKKFSPILKIPIGFWLIISLSVLGLTTMFSENRREAYFLLSFLVPYLLGIVLFFVTARFRIALVPILMIAAGFAIFSLHSTLRKRNYKKLGLYAGIVIIISSISLSNIYEMKKPKLANSLYTVGNIYMRKKKVKNAKNYYKKALQKYQNLSEAHLNLGVIYFRQKEYDEAIEEFKKEIELNPHNAEAYSNLGVIYRIRGIGDSAKYYGKKAIERGGGFIDGYLNLGITLRHFGELDKALEYIKKGLELAPNNIRLLNEAGGIYQKKGEYQKAIKYFKDALSTTERDFVRNYDIGSVFEKQSGLGSSRERLKAIAFLNLGTASAKQGHLNEAYRKISKAIDLNPGLEEAYYQLGVCLNYLGDYEKALKKLSKAESLGIRNPRLYFNIGNTYAKMRDFRKAKTFFKKAVEKDSSFQAAKKNIRILEKILKKDNPGRIKLNKR